MNCFFVSIGKEEEPFSYRIFYVSSSASGLKVSFRFQTLHYKKNEQIATIYSKKKHSKHFRIQKKT